MTFVVVKLLCSLTTGDEFEASMAAEAVDTALSILNAQGILSDR